MRNKAVYVKTGITIGKQSRPCPIIIENGDTITPFTLITLKDGEKIGSLALQAILEAEGWKRFPEPTTVSHNEVAFQLMGYIYFVPISSTGEPNWGEAQIAANIRECTPCN